MMAFTAEQRAYDHLYDPVWTTPGHNNLASTAKGTTDVSGSFRFRYCEKPIVSLTSEYQPGPEIVCDTTPHNAGETSVSNESRSNTAPARTVGCQTTYRDSEAQTDPYTPEYNIIQRQGIEEEVEIMSLSHLTFGNGLPVTDKGINRIERDRDRREMEKTLPPITDSTTLELHRKFLEDQERKDFKLRENEINEEMTKRLEDFQRSLYGRDAESKFLMEQRVEAFRRKKLNERHVEIGKIQKQRTFSLRKQAKISREKNHNPMNLRRQSCSHSTSGAENQQGKTCEQGVGATYEDFVMLQNDSLNTLVRISNIPGDNRNKKCLSAEDRRQAALVKDLQLVSNQLDLANVGEHSW